MSFSLYKALLFILSHITVERLCKIFYFFNLVLKLVFQRLSPNWRPIDFDFLWKDGIEKRGTKMKKDAKHGWHAISFVKDALWSLNFKKHANYIILVHQYFSNSILVQKFIFVIFSPWLREKREGSLDSNDKERKVLLTSI